MSNIHHSTSSVKRDGVLILANDITEKAVLGQLLQQNFNVHLASLDESETTLQHNAVAVVMSLSSGSDVREILELIALFASRSKVMLVMDKAEEVSMLSVLEAGASDVLFRPIDGGLLSTKLRRMVHVAHLEREIERLRANERQIKALLGDSPSIIQLLRMVDRIATTDVNTLIVGESGSGKGVVARSLHDRSARSGMPFIAINCASLPEALLDVELFGTQASLGATHPVKAGKIEAASGGTLFLDEIGDLPVATQAKLVRFLQERRLTRFDDDHGVPVDVKVISATHHDINQRISEKKLREDFLNLVGEVTINIPPLRDRGSDVLLLAKSFLLDFNHALNRKVSGFTEDAVNAMMTYAWPGNIRELQNKVKSAVIMADGTQLSANDLALTKEHRKDNGLPLN